MACRRRGRLLGPTISFACRLRGVGDNLARSVLPGTRCKVYKGKSNLYLIFRGVGNCYAHGRIASALQRPLPTQRGLLYSVEFRIVDIHG